MAKARILIADDDDAYTGVVSWLLKEQGYDVAVSPGGAHLLEQMIRTPPDLLLLDVAMRAGGGYPLLERINGDERWRDMPVLVVSALSVEDSTTQLIGMGASDVIRKPFEARELLTRIRVQLRVRQELADARTALRTTEDELRRVRHEVESGRQLVDILHEVTGDFSPEELYHILVRRVARAVSITHCSLILARPGDATGVVIAAYETPGLRHLEIQISRYPEIKAALESAQPVLIEDVSTSPLYSDVRREWAAAGTAIPFRSVITLPFRLDGETAGVVFLRTIEGEAPLGRGDVEFADTVVSAAVGAIRRARTIESTRADKARLEVLALTDPLTQAHNRRALMERLASEVERVKRYSLSLSVLMVDLDHFKAVNDSYGHLVGDEVLRGVAHVLQREARAVDVVARYGGEEFVVVLPETGTEGAIAVAERIRARIAEHAPISGPAYEWLRVTVSIGVAILPSPRASTPEELIALADEALYRAKAEGRNRVCS
ncbi:MAG TPA: diguanylate cyclase [Gemmatimonadaceae bacterium]|nr:diguanylate cyclase [Gemmatimonadaceae bacterium]